jgi:Fe2+ or Zn2+ uptake regulation protein
MELQMIHHQMALQTVHLQTIYQTLHQMVHQSVALVVALQMQS